MKPSLLPQHVIAIGASAGGIEPLYDFFDNTPLDHVSYVVVQHLSPNHQSRLVELLAKHSPLQVGTAQHDQLVEENRVYVIPNKVFLTIRSGKLQLTQKQGQPGPHRTVNTFFTSLAVDQKDKAIGIILSGTGTDGGDGIRSIKQAGGLVLVQDPATATYADMPTNAIATGVVDAVLAPAALPAAIREYVLKKADSDFLKPLRDEKEESDMEAILLLIKSRLPLDFSDYKRATIFRRIRKRMAHHRVKHSDQYLALLQSDALELEALARCFLISVTEFFRNAEAFELLERDVIPVMMQQSSSRDIKIWVAGCATGEEAYSIAILIQEYLDKHQQQRVVKIFATDLDKVALTIAARGSYSASVAAPVGAERLKRFFTRVADTYQVIPALRSMLIFSQHDLGRNPPYCNVDLISCRNLLIYLNPILQTKIFRMLHFGLQKGGFLFLGSSENPIVLKAHVREISKRWKIYQKTDQARPAVFETFALPIVEQSKPLALLSLQPTQPLAQKYQLADLVNTALMEEYKQAGVCVDQNGQVLQSFGDLSPYLLPKVFNWNWVELLPEPLATAYGAASHRAFKDHQRVEMRGIRLGKSIHRPSDDGNQVPETDGLLVTLLVKPFIDPRNQQKWLLVLLGEENRQPADQPPSEWFDPAEHTREYVVGMEEEHRETKEQLQAAQERLEASQENMLSFNEELLSANEEMQSANEELQSVNEELQTVNGEHQAKIRELTELNDDLNNYFRSNVSGQLFVDKNLLLKKFSLAAQEQINVRESDIGRPLHEITTNIKLETLIEDIQQVISLGTIIRKEVQSTKGKWYQVKTMPYIRQSDNQQNGAIISFHDITELKRYQHEIDQSNARLRRTNADLDSFVYMASHDLRGPIINLDGLLTHLTKSLASKSSEAEQQILSLTAHSVDKLKKTIHNLTEVVKVQQDPDGPTESVDMVALLEELKDDLAEMMGEGLIRATFAVPQLAYNRNHLRSILYNLLSNALKYRSPLRPALIQVSTEPWGAGVRLSVADNGMGMQAKQLSKLFTMGIRFHPEIEGTGLGLYTIKRLIENQGGSIHVESKPDQGTTFRIELPTVKGVATSAHPIRPAILPA